MCHVKCISFNHSDFSYTARLDLQPLKYPPRYTVQNLRVLYNVGRFFQSCLVADLKWHGFLYLKSMLIVVSLTDSCCGSCPSFCTVQRYFVSCIVQQFLLCLLYQFRCIDSRILALQFCHQDLCVCIFHSYPVCPFLYGSLLHFPSWIKVHRSFQSGTYLRN